MRLELAAILSWQGEYRQTLDLLDPLTSRAFPGETGFHARQLIGDTHFRHDQYDLASRQYHENLQFAKAASLDYWIARAEEGVAWVLVDVGHYTSGEFDEAEKIFLRYLPFHQRTGDRICEGMSAYGQSRAAAGMGHYTRAIELARRSIEILTANNGSYLLQLPLLQIANINRDKGNFDEAVNWFEKALDAADAAQDPYLQVLGALGYGILLKYLHRPDAAAEMWRSVLGLAKELDFPRLGSELCSKLATSSVDRGDFESAYSFQLLAQEYGNRVGVMSSILQNQQMLLRDHMHAALQLEAALSYLRAGVEASADGIFVLERPQEGYDADDFLIHFANESAARMFNKKPVHLLHVPLKSVWKTNSSELLLGPSIEVWTSGESKTLDPVQLEFVTGASRQYSVRIAKIPDGVVWSVSDVTVRQAMQQEILDQHDRLLEANSRLTSLDKEKSEMLGIAAHDLRSPIGNIRSLSELITTDDPENVELLGMIQEVSDSLLRLIENLLDVEKIERGELAFDLVDLDVSVLAGQLVEGFFAEAAQKGIRIGFEFPEAPVTTHVDESALRRVLQNLLSNAVKFSPADKPVWVRVRENGFNVRIEIEDRGPGITEADRKKLFGKFARLSARPTAGESSTGLGLSIVKRLMEAQGGAVGCDSVPGEGSTFWVEFPTLDSSGDKQQVA